MSKKVIGFHYAVNDKEGNLIDTSEGSSPLLFLEGAEQIIPGLEKELLVLKVGDKKQIQVTAGEAYGEIMDDMVIKVNKSQLPQNKEVQVGDEFQANNHPHAPVFVVKEIAGDEVTLDGNHPLAGKDLVFKVEITEVRDATLEEIKHGHAHGPHGHHHH